MSESASLKGAIDTSSILASALERLNRKSVIGLLDRLMDEINSHYSGIDGAIAAAKQSVVDDLSAATAEIKDTTDGLAEDTQNLTGRVSALETSLTEHINDYTNNLASTIDGRITSKKDGIVNDAVTAAMPKVTEEVERLLGLERLAEVREKIEQAQRKIDLVETAANSLNDEELSDVTQAIENALANSDLSELVASAEIPVNGTPVRFDKLLGALANQPKVANITMSYVQDHIAGAKFEYSNNTSADFTASRDENEQRLIYRFSANDMFGMSGLSGEFTLTFEVRGWQKDVCGTSLSMKQYDAVQQSNVVFDLTIE